MTKNHDQARLEFAKLSPEGYQAMSALERHVRSCGLERPLIELVKLRASQLNGCAFCIDMHWKDARAAGETEQRLYSLDAWRETSFYTERERAALEWTEAVTLISKGGVSDELFARARKSFSDKELVELNWAVAAINAWNRMSIAFHSVAGRYQPAAEARQ